MKLSDMGFNVCRLRDERPENEFLLYNKETNIYHHYNKNRFNDILIKELKETQEVDFSTPNNKVLLSQMIDKELYLLDNINFKPCDETIFKENGRVYWNTYRKSKLLKDIEKNIKKNSSNDSFRNIQKLIMHLIDYDKKAYDYFNMWIAHIIRNPLDKLPTAIIFQGSQGTGKGTLFELILKPIFENNLKSLSLNDLQKTSSNEWIFAKQMIFAEEIMNNDNKQEIPQVIKTYVSNPTISIQRMHKSSLDVINYSHWILCSNKPNPIQIEEWDRRYSVFKQLKKISYKQVKALKENIETELKEYLNYLYSIEIDFKTLLEPFETKARNDLINMNKDTISTFLDDVTENGKGFLIDGLLKYTDNIEYEVKKEGVWVSTKTLYDCYKLWCSEEGVKSPFMRARFTQTLTFKGWITKPARIKDKIYNSFLIPAEYSIKKNVQTNSLNNVTAEKAEQIEKAWSKKDEVLIDDTYI